MVITVNKSKSSPLKILIVRNDRIGDFIVSLPSFRLIKTAFPEAKIHALVPEYTAPIAQASNYIDSVIIDPGREKGYRATLKLARLLKSEQYDAVITLFSTSHVGVAVFLARIPYRLAPATKIAQYFYNHRLMQRRSRSEKAESEYNLDLAEKFITDHNMAVERISMPPYLQFPEKETVELRKNFCQQYHIPPNYRLIFVHPGHGGSANNLSPKQYAELSNKLLSIDKTWIVVSAGPEELHLAKEVDSAIEGGRHCVYYSDKGLLNFAKHLQFADVFVGGSTGPLHIAGALDRPTVAFYPRGRVTSALRWQTLNSPDKKLAFVPLTDKHENDMSSIKTDRVFKDIVKANLLRNYY